MTDFGKALAITVAIATGPILAYAAVGVRDYIASETLDDDFSLDGAFISPGSGGGFTAYSCSNPADGCTVYGHQPGGYGSGWTWAGGWGYSGYGAGSSSDPRTDDLPPPDPVIELLDCEKDNLAYDLAGLIRPSLPSGNESGAILADTYYGVTNGVIAYGSPGTVNMVSPYGMRTIDFLGTIHSHPPRATTSNPALDEAYRIADQYPSSEDWWEMETHAMSVLSAGGDPYQISMYIVDSLGFVREFPYYTMSFYNVGNSVLLQSIPGGPPRPPLPAPIVLPRFCG